MLVQWCLVLICCSVVVFVVVKYRKKCNDSRAEDLDSNQKVVFEDLQYRYLCGFTAASFADWLYGPYIFPLYVHYGYDSKVINALYMSGFFSSMVFGTVIGYLADAYGRKKMCLCYNIFGIISSLCKTSTSLHVLLLSHILSGINASILMSIFSVWYMHEHIERLHIPVEYVSTTFTIATVLNGVLAIMAGAVADLGVHYAHNHPVAPFLLMIPIFIISTAFIWRWEENAGSESSKQLNCTKSISVLGYLKDPTLLLMGAVQSLTEASIYAFIVVWPPLLKDISLPHGLIFAMLMTSLSLGAAIMHLFSKERIGLHSLGLALQLVVLSFLMLTLLYSTSAKPADYLLLVPSLIIEFATGIYFPSFGSLLSVVVPEDVRASISNLFRLPMNLFMCVILMWSHHTGHQEFFSLFSVCLIMAIGALVASKRLSHIRESLYLSCPKDLENSNVDKS